MITATSEDIALGIDCVNKTFGEGPEVLKDISLAIVEGEVLAIVGPSGCGKTTLLRIIQGLETVTSGSVKAVGSREERMSYVFQLPNLLPWFNVRKNVSFGTTLRAGKDIYATRAEREEAIGGLLQLVGLTDYSDYYPRQISGGMQQRVNVARALAVRPSVLLLDEPFSALDAMTRERLQVDTAGILSELRTTTLLVTHDIREAVFLADRVVVLDANPGRIRETVPVDQPRPRDAEFQHSPELAKMVQHIWHLLHA